MIENERRERCWVIWSLCYTYVCVCARVCVRARVPRWQIQPEVMYQLGYRSLYLIIPEWLLALAEHFAYARPDLLSVTDRILVCSVIVDFTPSYSAFFGASRGIHPPALFHWGGALMLFCYLAAQKHPALKISEETSPLGTVCTDGWCRAALRPDMFFLMYLQHPCRHTHPATSNTTKR